ncbi:MAG: hypothetical protein M1508_00625 [Nitrospirae bacterium]|nr:hypothetical protein [Nitrospirota bacterium]MCL5422945.1 hypothetical protein [Nitrospirota bacterium]
MFHSIVAKFRTASGVCDGFVKDAVRTNPVLPPNLITKRFQPFHAKEIRNTFFKEVNLYLDKAIYQYILSRRLLRDGNFSWGAVTQYYANFFAISGLIRLFENGFSRIGNTSIEVDSQANIYRIRKISSEGLHRVVWGKYYALFNDFDYKREVFYAVYVPYEPGNYYFESDRRNNLNYDPGVGYQELYQTRKTIQSLVRERARDLYSSTSFSSQNEWIDLDSLTQQRIRLLGNVIFEIDRVSEFPSFGRERLLKRNAIVHKYEQDKKLRDRISAWLEGE